MVYHWQCEPLRFVFASFGPRRRPKRNEGEGLIPWGGARRRVSKEASEDATTVPTSLRLWIAPSGKLRAGFPGRFAPQNEVFEIAAEGAKKCAKVHLSR
jgi:hypothetical protein